MVNPGEYSWEVSKFWPKTNKQRASSQIINGENEVPETISDSIADIHLHKCLLH